MLSQILTQLLDKPSFCDQVDHSIKNIQANNKISIEGQTQKSLYLIQSGSARVVLAASKENNLCLRPGIAELGPNDIFGEYAMFDQSDNSDVYANICTLVDSNILCIDVPTFKLFLEHNLDIKYKIYLELAYILANRLRKSDIAIYKIYGWGIKTHQLDKYLSK